MEYELHARRDADAAARRRTSTPASGSSATARILQDVASVYDTDGFQQIMDWIAAESGVAYGDSPDATKAHRVLADHGRGMTFLVADGVTPSNEGRGYVLRRIIRRAVQQAQRIGLDRRLPRSPGVVVEQMGDAYPELRRARRRDRGGRAGRGGAVPRDARARHEAVRASSPTESAITGEEAFTLAATYGFPVELTVELAEERGQAVDVDGYRQLMDEHREISRAGGGKGDTQRAAEFARAAGFATQFVGYEKTDVLTQLGALEELGDGLFLAKLRESPFYPDGGGQVTDRGELVARGDRRDARRCARRSASTTTRRCCSRARASPRATACARVVPVVGAVPDDGEPHRDAPAPAGAARRARRAREAGRLGGAARQAALRLHAIRTRSARRSASRSSGA